MIMRVDLLAGTVYSPVTMPAPAPTILVFDSGLGGLTIHAELTKVRPDARYVYVADDAGFPYGLFAEAALAERVTALMARLIARYAPDLVVVACNTASTVNVVLPHLRAHFDLPFVGTVPPIKPAAALSRSRLISVLATPGTVARAYTKSLIEAHAGECRVTLVGAPRLAELATAELCGEPVRDGDVLAEIAPAFVQEGAARTDVVALGCTHYPLLLSRFQRLAPWPVTWIDPAPAVARRVVQLLGETVPGRSARDGGSLAVFTNGTAIPPNLRLALADRGLFGIAHESAPLAEALTPHA
jgi:glutamate racemase